MTPNRLTALLALTLLPLPALLAQEENGIPTQVLVRADSKEAVLPTAASVNLQLDGKSTPLTSLNRVNPNGIQVALLIDDGLSRSAGVQLSDLRAFPSSLPPGTEILVGYMQNGRVVVTQPFTTDHAAAAQKIRIPESIPGQSASPYFCLSDFVKRWDGGKSRSRGDEVEDIGGAPAAAPARKARFVIMITNGVDPYNGSTSPLNQDSPYVQTAVNDAQRAGVTVYPIYYRDAGFGGGQAAFSGQSYLSQVADGTGGELFYEGLSNPVSLKPFFDRFNHDISETFVATFNAPGTGGGRDHLVRLKMSTSTPKLKLRHPDAIRPGNLETVAEVRE